MVELLRSIPGPQFLVLFALLVVIVSVLGKMMIARLEEVGHLPGATTFSPSALAALRGGWELAVKTAVFGLWRRNVIEIAGEKGATAVSLEKGAPQQLRPGVMLQRRSGVQEPSDPLEKGVFAALAAPKTTPELFADGTLKFVAQHFVTQQNVEFARYGLVRDRDGIQRAWKVTLAVLAVVYGVGGLKLALGIAHHRPFGFLLFMMIIALPVIIIVLSPYGTLTFAGKTYLKRLDNHFAWVRDDLQNGREPQIDPAYAFALFGVTALAGSLLYADFAEAFPRRTPGGCGGSGCGGMSGSDGGGSDGGGGDGGGGGCGGCGGGGD
jgi:uncharacterized protein (TIGR04222 family)